MKIEISRIGNSFKMQARNEQGNTLLMDSAPEHGGKGEGMRPMQLLLSALGGCSAIDVITILQKQKQFVEQFDVEVEGDRKTIEDYKLFNNICIHFKLKGALDVNKVERAIKLSLHKYCSVAKTLEPHSTISYKLTIRS